VERRKLGENRLSRLAGLQSRQAVSGQKPRNYKNQHDGGKIEAPNQYYNTKHIVQRKNT